MGFFRKYGLGILEKSRLRLSVLNLYYKLCKICVSYHKSWQTEVHGLQVQPSRKLLFYECHAQFLEAGSFSHVTLVNLAGHTS